MSTLIYAMGDQADDVLRSFTLTKEDRKTYTTVKSKFDNHFIQRRNVIFERAKFNRRRLKENDLLKVIAAVNLSPKDRYPSLFRGLGKLKGDYHIELQDDA